MARQNVYFLWQLVILIILATFIFPSKILQIQYLFFDQELTLNIAIIIRNHFSNIGTGLLVTQFCYLLIKNYSLSIPISILFALSYELIQMNLNKVGFDFIDLSSHILGLSIFIGLNYVFIRYMRLRYQKVSV